MRKPEASAPFLPATGLAPATPRRAASRRHKSPTSPYHRPTEPEARLVFQLQPGPDLPQPLVLHPGLHLDTVASPLCQICFVNEVGASERMRATWKPGAVGVGNEPHGEASDAGGRARVPQGSVHSRGKSHMGKQMLWLVMVGCSLSCKAVEEGVG